MTEIEDEFAEVEQETPQPWSWARFAGIGVASVGSMFAAVALACQETAEAVASHIEYRRDRSAFVESVSSDINQIATGNYR